MVPSYDYWLFDLDGTLVSVDPDYPREVFAEVGDRLGYGFSDEQVHRLWHGLGGVREAQLREWGLDPDEFWPTLHDVEDPVARAEATFLHADAEALLADIDDPVGVVTHCAPFLAEPVVEHLDLRDRFDAFVCCSDELGWKPDPTPVEHAIGRMGAMGDGVLAGDSAADVGAAWNAGIDGVHVERHGPERRGQCVLADYRVESFDMLPRQPYAADD